LDEVSNHSGAQTSSQADHSLLGNNLLDAANQTSVVLDGVELDASLDHIDRAG